MIITNRIALISHLKYYWEGQGVYVQVIRELGCRFDIYLEDIYEIEILKQRNQWIDNSLRYQRITVIIIDKWMYEQLCRMLQFPKEALLPMMSVEAFIDGILTRAEIIDALLPLL